MEGAGRVKRDKYTSILNEENESANLPWIWPLFPAALKSLTIERSVETSELAQSSSYNLSPSTTLTLKNRIV